MGMRLCQERKGAFVDRLLVGFKKAPEAAIVCTGLVRSQEVKRKRKSLLVGSLTRDDEACSFVRVRDSELSLSKQYGCLSIVSEAPSDRLRFGFGFGFKSAWRKSMRWWWTRVDVQKQQKKVVRSLAQWTPAREEESPASLSAHAPTGRRSQSPPFVRPALSCGPLHAALDRRPILTALLCPYYPSKQMCPSLSIMW